MVGYNMTMASAEEVSYKTRIVAPEGELQPFVDQYLDEVTDEGTDNGMPYAEGWGTPPWEFRQEVIDAGGFAMLVGVETPDGTTVEFYVEALADSWDVLQQLMNGELFGEGDPLDMGDGLFSIDGWTKTDPETLREQYDAEVYVNDARVNHGDDSHVYVSSIGIVDAIIVVAILYYVFKDD